MYGPISTQEAAEEAKGWTEAEQEQLKRDVLSNLYSFAKGICGYKDITKGAHGAFCKFLETKKKLRKLSLMPRAHLKTTIGVVADPARCALIDPDEYRGAIFGETATKAEANLRQLKGLFEKNELIRALWPAVIPSRFSGPGVQWSTTVACLQRATGYREPTFTALGMGGSSGVGWHFTDIRADDLIGFEAMRSPAKMAEAIAFNDNIEPLLVNQHTDSIYWIGTRWSIHDLYARLMDVYGPRLAVFTRSAIESGEIIFPNLHTWEEYNQLMQKNPFLWFSQYLNNPQSGLGNDFDITKVGVCRLSGGMVFYEDQLTRREKSWRLDQLFLGQTCDPNSGSLLAPDTAAIVVSALTPDNDVLVLDAWSDRVTPSGFVDKIWETALRWEVPVVGIEQAGQQTAHHYIQQRLDEEGSKFRLVELKPKNKNKELRIRDNLEPIINGLQLYTTPGLQTLRQQIVDFPQNVQYDLALVDELDALAYGPEVWRKPSMPEELKARIKRVKFLLRHRNRNTGY